MATVGLLYNYIPFVGESVSFSTLALEEIPIRYDWKDKGFEIKALNVWYNVCTFKNIIDCVFCLIKEKWSRK